MKSHILDSDPISVSKIWVVFLCIVTGFFEPPHVPWTDSHEPERDSSSLANLANPSFIKMVMHIFVVHSPNFKENVRIFEIAMNE